MPPAPVTPANISKMVITTGNLLAQFKYITGDAEKTSQFTLKTMCKILWVSRG